MHPLGSEFLSLRQNELCFPTARLAGMNDLIREASPSCTWESHLPKSLEGHGDRKGGREGGSGGGKRGGKRLFPQDQIC